MAIVQAITNQFKYDRQIGLQQPTDVYMLALYDSSASLDATTDTYTTSGEIAAQAGYVTGGMALTGFAVTLVGGTAILTFNNAIFTPFSGTANGAMIYNQTRSNHTCIILPFGTDQTGGGGNYTVTMPPATPASGLIRLA